MVLSSLLEFGTFGFHGVITYFGLSMGSEDHHVYVKSSTWGIMFLTMYVNDILLVGNN